MEYPIPYHPTWHVLDSTKLNTFMDCPRKMFYEYLLGWRSSKPNNHLVFGEAWHQAMEYLLINGIKPENAMPAYELFEEEYRKHLPPETDELYHPKSPQNVLIAIGEYINKYKNDRFETLFTEIGGQVSLGDDRMLSFRMDSVLMDDERNVYSQEHKTTSRFSRMWTDQWALSLQVGCYSHVLHCLYPGQKFFTIQINGASFQKNKLEFMRLDIERGAEHMNIWLNTINYWYDSYLNELKMLEECVEGDDTLLAFPLNPGACTKYFGCPYHDYCVAWPNPLQRAYEPPIGMEVFRWNPADKETKHEVNV